MQMSESRARQTRTSSNRFRPVQASLHDEKIAIEKQRHLLELLIEFVELYGEELTLGVGPTGLFLVLLDDHRGTLLLHFKFGYFPRALTYHLVHLLSKKKCKETMKDSFFLGVCVCLYRMGTQKDVLVSINSVKLPE